jgi:tRNA-Thr(GGU) m(6)t(6)A37 methyltransferase TsaA
VAWAAPPPAATNKPAPSKTAKPSAEAVAEQARRRAQAAKALAARLQLGPGSAVADIGAGRGIDSWAFAEIVGPTGTVYSEEVTQKQVDALRAEAQQRKLSQVRPVLGTDEQPGLPAGSVDLAHLRLVYHHLAQPRPMLRGIWKALKPGGYLVVIDQNRGTLQDWVPRAVRREKHFWIAETTVVREAREEGFRYVGLAEDCTDLKPAFALVFQRPKEPLPAGRDPDPFLPLPAETVARLLPAGQSFQHPAFIALGEGRKLIPPILERCTGPGVEIVLEEWATEKQERAALPPGVTLPSMLTEKGDPHLGNRPVDAVFFLDSYHLLFHGPTLLAKLREKLADNGRVFVLDRAAREPLSRREASHRRQIDPAVVKREMAAAGFFFLREGPSPAADRFLLVFTKPGPEAILMQPIGVIRSPYQAAHGTPIQGTLGDAVEACVELAPRYAPGLKDLDGFSHAILIYYFHKSDREEIVGKPYLEPAEHGIFAIRSPHRPNHIGFSVVKIKRIEGHRLHFTEVDMLDGTPVLDIKPYVKQFDARDDARSGWIERHFQHGQRPAVQRAN